MFANWYIFGYKKVPIQKHLQRSHLRGTGFASVIRFSLFSLLLLLFFGGEEISLMLFQYVVLEFQSEHIVVLIRVGCDSRTAWKWQLKTTRGWKMPHNSNQLHGKKTWGKIRKLQEYPQVESSANPKNSSVRGGRCHLLFSYGRHDSSQTGRLGP